MLTDREIERRETLPWCAGLPFVEDRPLRPEEKEEISQMAWRLLWQGLASIVVPLVLAPLFMAAFGYGCAHGSSPLLDGIFVTLAILSVFLLLLALAAPFASNGWLQRSRLLFDVLRRGYVREFAGSLDSANQEDQTVRRLRDASLLDSNANEPSSLSVLPRSHRLRQVNGRQCHLWIDASWIEVAKPPLPSLSSEFLDTPQTRRLSRAEQQEIRRYARGHWLKPLLPAVAFTFWAGGLLFLMLTGPLPRGKAWWDFADAVIAAIFADAFLAYGIREAWEVRQDAQGGVVEVHGSTLFEILPVSGREWTQDGQPSAWRRVKRPDE